jgi:hypothetical protein
MAGAALMVVLTELQKRLWSSGYFGLGELLTGFEYDRAPSILAVLAKAGIPFAGGFVAALVAPTDKTILALLAAVAGSFALAWPVLLSMDGIPPQLYGRQLELRLLHSMYVGTAAVLGLAGGIGATAAISVGGQRLAQFGSDVANALVVDVVKAILLIGIGAYSVQFQVRRSRRIKADTRDELDTSNDGDTSDESDTSNDGDPSNKNRQ